MSTDLLELTADIVGAYVTKNAVPMGELPQLIADVSQAISGLSMPTEPEPEKPKPAVNPKRSVHGDYIISLEDGQKFKSLKRPLMARYGLTPQQYREKWGLPADYPMIAPNYSTRRSELAKNMGLGRKPVEKAKAAKQAKGATKGRSRKA